MYNTFLPTFLIANIAKTKINQKHKPMLHSIFNITIEVQESQLNVY